MMKEMNKFLWMVILSHLRELHDTENNRVKEQQNMNDESQ